MTTLHRETELLQQAPPTAQACSECTLRMCVQSLCIHSWRPSEESFSLNQCKFEGFQTEGELRPHPKTYSVEIKRLSSKSLRHCRLLQAVGNSASSGLLVMHTVHSCISTCVHVWSHFHLPLNADGWEQFHSLPSPQVHTHEGKGKSFGVHTNKHYINHSMDVHRL